MQVIPINKIIENSRLFQSSAVSVNFENFTKLIQQKHAECVRKGILICTSDPWVFMGAFFASVFSKVPVFLANPNWRESEWEQVFSEVSPALVFGNAPHFSENSVFKDLEPFSSLIMIPTGGSGGKVRFAMHSLDNLYKSAVSTASFLKRDRINSLCLLPLFHISGLIQIIRASVTDGDILFDRLESFDKNHNFKEYCISLVPTQLERFMQNPDCLHLLKTFFCVFLGGAPATKLLLDQARAAQIRVVPTYGATETASMVAAMHPDDFLDGELGVGRALSHAKISIKENGIIRIQGSSIFSGYYPSLPIRTELWETTDEGYIDVEGRLTVVGRADRMIITGGEKVDPREIERAILATNFVSSVYVTSVKDNEWGQKIIAICVPATKGNDPSQRIRDCLKRTLANYKIPKEWLMVDVLPYDEKGKIREHVELRL